MLLIEFREVYIKKFDVILVIGSELDCFMFIWWVEDGFRIL